LYNPQTSVCDERVLNLQSILQSLAARVPKIMVQRVEEIYPSLKESLVSGVCLCAQTNVTNLFTGFMWQKKPNIL
jgi:hypothetical protein